jgi:predicted small lipoprotein YifL
MSNPVQARRSFGILASILLLALALAGCGNQSPALPAIFPSANVVGGWQPSGEVRTYNRDTIFDLVDGQADAFFAYGFEQVAVRGYQNAAGTTLRAEAWQLATPADAYGLFTANRSGTPAAVGNGGDTDPGRRLAFWKNRYFVSATATTDIPDADLTAFAQAIASALPSGGEPPAVVAKLPAAGLAERNFIFFHQELSIQDRLWLGGENILGLSHDTGGVVAQYDLGGTPAQLLLVQYPDAKAAAAGLAALKGGQVDDFITANVSNNVLGAVFGKVDAAPANALLEQALK